MGTTTSSKNNKASIVMLATATIFGLSIVFIFYSDFLIFPPTFDDIKYAVDFFYMPLMTALLALGALVLRLQGSSRKFSQLCPQLGLLLSGSSMAWWLIFERGSLTAIMLFLLFLAVVINDLKDNKQSSP